MKKDLRDMTPQELMISRYEAFKRRDWDYLVKTSTDQTVPQLQESASIEWLKLDIIDAYENFVEFKAYYRENGALHLLHEKSSFIEENGYWKYSDGILYNSKIQRNEICPCGSGKKYKKCCFTKK